jgi:phosphonopyruvate decarboxylase
LPGPKSGKTSWRSGRAAEWQRGKNVTSGTEIVEALLCHGFSSFVGVPCSLLAPLFSELAYRGAMTMATEEGEAVGIAAGMYLAGRKPVVLMQNAGFLNALNPLLSLHAVFDLPLLLVVSHRGEPGVLDAPEHEPCGRLTLPLLDLAGITRDVIPPDGGAAVVASIDRAAAAVDGGGRYALVVTRGTVQCQAAAHTPPRPSARNKEGTFPEFSMRRTLRRRDILAAVFARHSDAVFVASTGFIAREAVAASARARACLFPVIGSMGCAAPIGLGLALSAPHRQVVVLDGDGALLMKLGVLASMASHAPANLLHVVFNDGVYASTGGQANAAGSVSLARLAYAAGYATSVQAETAAELEGALGAAAHAAGPHLISVATTCEPSTEAPRVDEPPAACARRLRALRLCERQASP